MNSADYSEAAEGMVSCGGSFVSALGNAYRYADTDNRAKLVETFGHYFRRYEKVEGPSFAGSIDPAIELPHNTEARYMIWSDGERLPAHWSGTEWVAENGVTFRPSVVDGWVML
tara:strand:+ start:13283 stop:13624 length:342 start_codon:yes stop_codon:yes gene_type:complete